MSESWFYSDGGRSFGPVDEEVIHTLITDGTVGREHFVMPEEGDDWEKISESKFSGALDEIWYYSDSNDTFGPYPEKTIRQLIGSGQIEPHFFVMRGSESDWTPLSESKFAKVSVASPKPPSTIVSPTPLKRKQSSGSSSDDTDSSEKSTPPSKSGSLESSNNLTKVEIPVQRKESDASGHDLEKLREELSSLKKEMNEWTRRTADAEKERADALRESQAATKKLAQKEKDLQELNKQLDRKAGEADKTRKELSNLRGDLDAAQEELKQNRNQLESKEKELSELQKELKSTDENKTSSIDQEELKKLQQTLEKLEKLEEDQAAKSKRLSLELAETSSLLVKAKSESEKGKEKVEFLEKELSKAKSEIEELQESGSEADLRKQVRKLEQQLKGADGSDLGKEVETLKSKLVIAETEAEVAKEELGSTREKLEAKSNSNQTKREPWIIAVAACVAAVGLGIYAWIGHNKAAELADAPAKIETLSGQLATAESNLEQANTELQDSRSKLSEASMVAADGTSKNAAFTSKLLDQIAAISGPIDPDTIAEMRRETESHFGLADKVEEADSVRARDAIAMLASGDKLREADDHEGARRKYREASLAFPPLLLKYPSKAFWRGDLITTYARLAEQEIILKEIVAAEEALGKAMEQLGILRKDDEERADVRAQEVAMVWEQLASQAAQQGDYGRAQTSLGQSIATLPGGISKQDPEIRLRLYSKMGEYAADTNDWVAAESNYRKASEDAPDQRTRIDLLAKIAQAQRNLGMGSAAATLDEEVLAYYQKLIADSPTFENQIGLVRALNSAGESRRTNKDYEGATSAYLEAEKVLQAIFETSPTGADFNTAQRELALTNIRLGELEMEQKSYAAARERFLINIPTLRVLSGKEPKNTDLLDYIQRSYLNIARCHALEEDHESAMSAYANAIDAAEKLHTLFPENRAYALNCAKWKASVGNYQKSLKKIENAGKNLRDALEIYNELEKSSDDQEIKKQIASINSMLGELELIREPNVAIRPEVIEEPDGSQPPEEIPSPPAVPRNQSETFFRDSVASAKELAEGNPDDTDLQHKLGIAYEQLAEFLKTAGKFVDSQTEYQNCLAVREKLLKSSASPNPLWFHEVARTYSAMAVLQMEIGTFPISEQYFMAALGHGESAVEAAVKAGKGIPADWRAHVGESNLWLGKLDQFSRQFYQARRRFQKAVEILNEVTEVHDDLYWKMRLIEAYGGLSANFMTGTPQDSGISRALATKGLNLLKQLDAQGKLTDSERDWYPQLERLAGVRRSASVNP